MMSRREGDAEKHRDETMEGSPLKQRRSDPAGAAVTVEMMQRLLADTQQAILANQREIMREELRHLEARTEDKFDKVQQTMENHDSRLETMEKAIHDLQARHHSDQASTTVGSEHSGRDETKDRKTIVVGGWPRDTKRSTILEAMGKIIRDLDVTKMLDKDAFVTGPRRSYCMIPFQQRARESREDCKDRMYGVINKIMARQDTGPSRKAAMGEHCQVGIGKTTGGALRLGSCRRPLLLP